MQRIVDIRKLKAISKEIRKDKIESLASAESNHLCNISNHLVGIMFSFYQTSSTSFNNERAN